MSRQGVFAKQLPDLQVARRSFKANVVVVNTIDLNIGKLITLNSSTSLEYE